MFMGLRDTMSLGRFEDQLADRYLHEVKEISMLSLINLNDFSVGLVMGIFKKHFKSQDFSRAANFNNEIRLISEAKLADEAEGSAKLAEKAEALAKVYFELKNFNEIAWVRSDKMPFEQAELEFLLGASPNLEKASKEFLECCKLTTVYKAFHQGAIQEEQLLGSTEQMCREWKASVAEITASLQILPVNYRLECYSVKDLLISNLAYLQRLKLSETRQVKSKISSRRIFSFNPSASSNGKSDLSRMAEGARPENYFITNPESELFKPRAWPSTLETSIPLNLQIEAPKDETSSQIELSNPHFQVIQEPTKVKKKPVKILPQEDEQNFSEQFLKSVNISSQIPQIIEEKKPVKSEASYRSKLEFDYESNLNTLDFVQGPLFFKKENS